MTAGALRRTRWSKECPVCQVNRCDKMAQMCRPCRRDGATPPPVTQPRPTRRRPGHRRVVRSCGRCGDCRHCRSSETLKARYAQGWKPKRRFDAWSAEEDDLIRRLAGTVTATEIAAALTARGHRRTRLAVHQRAGEIGVPLYPETYSVEQLRRTFRVAAQTVIGWIEQGRLAATLPPHPKGRRFWRVQEDDLYAFLRAYPWLYDGRVVPLRHPLRRLVDVVWRRHAWITVREAAQRLGCRVELLDVLLVREGIDVRQRAGTAVRPIRVIREDDLVPLRAALSAHRAAVRETTLRNLVPGGGNRWKEQAA